MTNATSETKTNEQTIDTDSLGITSDIVCAYLAGGNKVEVSALGDLIATTFTAVSSMVNPAPASDAAPTRREPAVSVRSSIKDDHLVSLLDGKKYKTLRRHLSRHGMTPESYRAEFGLKPDYPMVAPQYGQLRSEMAKKIGLGRKRATDDATAEKAPKKARRARTTKAEATEAAAA